MRKTYKFSLMMTTIMAVLFAMACDGGKIDEANKFVDAGNQKVAEAGQLIAKVSKMDIDILETKYEDFAEFKKSKELEAKQIVKDYEKCAELFKGAAKDFGDASKVNLDAKVKTYFEAKSNEFEKSAESFNLAKQGAQSLLNSKNEEEHIKKLNESNEKSELLKKENDALTEKAKKLEAEAKEFIKPQ